MMSSSLKTALHTFLTSLSSPLLSFGAGSRESSVAAALVQTVDFYQIYLSFTYLTLQQYAIHPYQRHKHRLFLVHDSGSAESVKRSRPADIILT
jgi:hypothetical protein